MNWIEPRNLRSLSVWVRTLVSVCVRRDGV